MYAENSGSIEDYWDGQGDGQSWYYADLICQLSPQASLTTFTVDEVNSTRTDRLMFPMSMCTQSNDTASFSYNGSGVGMSESTDDNGGGFQFGCPLFPNGYENAQIMAGPSISSGDDPVLGCYLMSSQNTTWQTVQPNGTPQMALDFPARILTFTRSNPWSTDSLGCGLWNNGSLASNGDGKIMSYRVW